MECLNSFFLKGGEEGLIGRKFVRKKFTILDSRGNPSLTDVSSSRQEKGETIRLCFEIIKSSLIFAYSSVSCSESRKHIFVAGLLFLLVLFHLLLADSDLIDGCFVFRFVFEHTFEVGKSFLRFAECQVRLPSSIKSFDILCVESERFIALKILNKCQFL